MCLLLLGQGGVWLNRVVPKSAIWLSAKLSSSSFFNFNKFNRYCNNHSDCNPHSFNIDAFVLLRTLSFHSFFWWIIVKYYLTLFKLWDILKVALLSYYNHTTVLKQEIPTRIITIGSIWFSLILLIFIDFIDFHWFYCFSLILLIFIDFIDFHWFYWFSLILLIFIYVIYFHWFYWFSSILVLLLITS